MLKTNAYISLSNDIATKIQELAVIDTSCIPGKIMQSTWPQCHTLFQFPCPVRSLIWNNGTKIEAKKSLTARVTIIALPAIFLFSEVVNLLMTIALPMTPIRITMEYVTIREMFVFFLWSKKFDKYSPSLWFVSIFSNYLLCIFTKPGNVIFSMFDVKLSRFSTRFYKVPFAILDSFFSLKRFCCCTCSQFFVFDIIFVVFAAW